jgi:hypothetical protein
MKTPESNPVSAPGSAADRSVLRDTLAALWIAWWQARLPGRRPNPGALLPPVGSLPRPEAPISMRLFQRVNRIVRVAVFWKFDKQCFYRSFAAASVLRKRGIPARLNFGLRLNHHRRQRCHCWVTIDDQPLDTGTDPRKMFPLWGGQSKEDVHYWLADGDSSEPAPAEIS